METEQTVEEFNRALLSLEGLIYGITADGIISRKELEKLKEWKKLHYEKIRHHPAGDLIQMLDGIVTEQILPEHDRQFIRDFCREYVHCDEMHDSYRCDLIRMEGYIQGILADNKIYEGEIISFRKWLNERPRLVSFKGYKEMQGIIRQFLDEKSLSREALYSYLENLRISL